MAKKQRPAATSPDCGYSSMGQPQVSSMLAHAPMMAFTSCTGSKMRYWVSLCEQLEPSGHPYAHLQAADFHMITRTILDTIWKMLMAMATTKASSMALCSFCNNTADSAAGDG